MSGDGAWVRATVSGHARAAIAGRDVHVHHDGGAVRRASPNPDAQCPYPGLAAFNAEQSRWFFGREVLTAHLVERAAERLDEGGPLIVVAPSGAGKSSLLRAGLLAAIGDRGALPVTGSARWPQVVITPTDRPVDSLARGIAAVFGLNPGEVVEWTTSPAAFVDALRTRLHGQRVVVVVDQLEELFTLCPDVGVRRVFLGLLDGVAATGSCGLVVYGLRIDAYAHCVEHPPLRRALQDGQVLVGPMTVEELRQAVVLPAREVGLEVEPGLVDLLLRDLGAADDAPYEVGRLPLLAHALRAVWRERHGHVLTVAGYRVAGGIRNAVTTTAERVYSGLDDAGRDSTHTLFLRLVKIGEGADDTRRTVLRADLSCDTAVLDAFTDARLLTQERDTVTITHETLIRAWPRMRDWIEEDRAGNLLRQKLEEAALAWDRDDRDPALLWRGNRFQVARVLVAEGRAEAVLNDRERAFLDACLDLEHEQHAAARRRTRRLKQFVAALTALVLVLAATTTYAVLAERRAVHARTRSVAQEAALRSGYMIGPQPDLAVELAHAAYRVAPSPTTRDALLNAYTALRRLPYGDHQPHSGPSIHIGKNGTTAISRNWDGELRSWRLDADHATPSGRFRSTLDNPHPSFLNGSVITFGDLSSTEVWDIAAPDAPRLLTTLPPGFQVQSASDDGRMLVGYDHAARLSSGETNTVKVLWDVSDPTRPRRIALPCTSGESTQIHPDGRMLATTCPTGGRASSIDLWHITAETTPQPLTTIPLDEPGEHRVEFSTDGGFLVAIDGEDHRARIWDIRDREQPRPWAEVVFDSDSSSFSFVDDTRVLLLHNDRELHFWGLADPTRPELLASVRNPFPIATSAIHRPQFDDYLVSDGQELWRIDLDMVRVTARICGDPDLRLPDDQWQEHLPDIDRQPVCP
ncbi:hypothetical protein JOF41_003606 [Saccharothrix coeruleofusca]|uniref:nSTAND1 domain-containing NTPase n=1 Tax=Saccharothrix coeruleofusca TaxID=33919 RepID=UPI001AE8CF71|nr:hypothetical protein [Saccharothrix coeruleofusca]MBP2337428.1 hypothetical protein [Saccharothrix coeruleofusca]